MDAKVHRKENKLEIKSLYLESKELKTPEGLDRVQRGVKEFAKFHSCTSIEIGYVKPRKFTTTVRSLFAEE